MSAVRARLRYPSSWVALGAGAAFVLLAFVVAERGGVGFDDEVSSFVQALPVPADVWRLLTDAGGIVLVPIGIAVVVGLLLTHRPASALIYGVALIGASIWTNWLKVTVARARPPGDALVVAQGFSFPSGHTLNSTVTYGLIALLVWRSEVTALVRRLSVLALGILMILIGLSRIALGVHYPSDVLGGWLCGVSIVALVATLTNPDPDRRTAEPAEAPTSE